MPRPTLTEISTAVRNTLEQAEGLQRAEASDTLTVGVQDLPQIKAYCKSGTSQEGGGNPMTLRGPVAQQSVTVTVNLLVRKHGQELGEGMEQVEAMTQAVINVIEAQEAAPHFGLPNSERLLRWDWDYTNFKDAQVMGAQFTLVIRLY